MDERLEGVRFAEVEGRRSSQAVGTRVFAAAARPLDADLASEISSGRDWRKRYLRPLRRLVEAGIRSSDGASRGAEDALAELHRSLELAREGHARPLAEAVVDAEPSFETASIRGRESGPPSLEIPYRGDLLSGDRLRRQLDRWVEADVIEPSCRDAVAMVIDEPGWLDLSDRTVAILGAASEMGPLIPLSRWGAHVLAVDVPVPRLWQGIAASAAAGRGLVSLPTHKPVTTGEDPAAAAGADLLSEAPELRAWLSTFDGPMTIADFTYADGGTFVLVAGAADAIVASLARSGADVSLAYLPTPTDVFAVPEEVAVAAARKRPRVAPFRSLSRTVTGRRLHVPNHATPLRGPEGRGWSVSDCLVPQQGANYALAKSLQRWRAMVARTSGVLVSSNVAPPTRTRSVVKNRVLAAAYRGAGAYGVEIFEPETSRWLMAAKLVHDLRNPAAAANPANDLAHPYDLFAEGAAHGGIWRMAYEPRSVLPLAVLRGAARR